MENNGTELTFKLDPNTLEGMIRQQIEVSVATALAGNGEALIQRLVTETLNQKVDSSGRVSRDSYNNKHPFITVITQNIIREATKEAVQEWADKHKEQIKTALYEQLATHPENIVDKLAESAAEGFARKTTWDWSVRVYFEDQD